MRFRSTMTWLRSAAITAALAAAIIAVFAPGVSASTLLPVTTITTAVSVAGASQFQFKDTRPTPDHLTVQVNFVYGSGGTTVDAYLQTSFDGAATWTDVCNFHFTTAGGRKAANLNAQTPVTTPVALTDGSMTANTCQDGLIGPLVRVKWGSAGTYAGGTTLEVDIYSTLRLTTYP